MRVVIIGAGGHAQVVADILLHRQGRGEAFQPLGYVDDRLSLQGRVVLGLPVLGTLRDLPNIAHDGAIIAIGDNAIRARVFALLQESGETLVNAIHPTAVVAPDVSLGVGVMVCAGAVINTGTCVGDNVILNTSCSIDHHNTIGSHAHIAPGVHLGGNVQVGIGAFLGIGAAIIPERVVGHWAIVGAGAVVISDIPAWTTWVGNPAQAIQQTKSRGETPRLNIVRNEQLKKSA
ncbi:MAG: acetyltransferase [Candidatus Binatia bacterium]